MRIRWYGHSCFVLTDNAGLRVMTDPFDESIGYAPPSTVVDLVTVSHSHFDHAAVERLPGAPRILQSVGVFYLGEVIIRGITVFHDDQNGKRRGSNLMYQITIDQIRILHCGDLGHLLQPQQLLQTGPVDVLIVPVGGSLTLGPVEAKGLCEQLKPKVVIPMHFRTPALSFPLASADEFVRLFSAEQIIRKESTVEINAEEMPGGQEVWVLDYQ